MPANPPPADDKKLTDLLLGQLPPDEAEQLSATLATDSRVVPAAESLPNDTLLAVVKNADTTIDPAGDKLAERIVERLQPTIGAATLTGPPGGGVAADDEPVPESLEYFRVEKVLGRGGMGTVYQADDTRLGRKVAVKTLRASVALKPGAKERFFREARLAASIEHDSVVPIYYVGESGDTPFLAMPLLRGKGLDDHLEASGGKLPVAEAVRVASQVAAGLAVAHAAGLIHRDIKPSNIWVDADGKRVRLLDFGLARFEEDDTNLTASGMIVGTPAYMAPEQARGLNVDARADLFSLGVVLYQMITGNRPFNGANTVAILTSLALDTPPDPVALNPDCPAALSDLVMRLLSKDPTGRPATANAVKAVLDRLDGAALDADRTQPDLGRVAAPRPKPTPKPAAKPTPSAAPRRKVPVAAVAIALGLLLLVGGGLAVMQLVFTSKDGTLVVEVDESADVRFKNGKLEVYDEAGKKLYTLEPSDKNKALPPGKYTVKVVGADGVRLDTDKFEIEKNGKALVKVTATGPEVAKKPDPVKPDPGKSAGPLSDTVLTLSKECGVVVTNPGIDPKKPWTVEAYLTPMTQGVMEGAGDLIKITDLGHLYFKGSKYGASVDGFQLGAFIEVGKRVHVAVVRTDTRVALFVDGKWSAGYDCKPQAEVAALPPDSKLLLGLLPEGKDFGVQEVRVSQTARYATDFTPPGRHQTDKETLALYHCDEGSGDKLTDSSGNNRHGKIANAKWAKPVGHGTPGAGDARFALRFDVHSDGVRWHAVEMPTLKLPTKDPVTIEGWVKLDDPLAGYNNVLFGVTHQLAVGRFGGSFVQAESGKEPVSTEVPTPDVEKAFYALGKWQHVAVVRDADEVRSYLDGKLAGRAACKHPLAEGAGFVFGNAGNKLSVREVRVSSAARYSGDKFTPESRFTPDKQTLALFHCDEGAGERVADSSGNGHHGTISGFGPDGMTRWVKADGSAVTPSAPGLPLALRKPTWKPGPADNILPGLATRPAILDGVGRWQIVSTLAYGSTAWSPDGKWVAMTDADYLRVYDTATGVMSSIARHGAPANHWAEPRWSADSKWVLCGVPAPPGLRFIAVFAPDGTPGAFPPVAHAAADFGWNPKHPVFACVVLGQDRIQIFDPTRANPIEIDAKIGSKGRAVWSPDGETLLVVREDKTAQLFGRDGKAGAKLAGEVDPIAPPAWSADSKQIAAMASETEVGFWKVDGTAGKKTGKHEKGILGLHWKPDGQLLAVSEVDGKRLFWKTDGTSEWSADTKDGTPGLTWAKDGKGFFTPGKFWPAVGNPSFTSLTNALDMVAVVSPDQLSVALAKRGEIVIAEWKGGEAKDTGMKILQTADGIPWWSADGKRFAVADADGVTLYDARDPKKVLRLGGGAGVSGLSRASFSPKGDRLAVANNLGTLAICEPTGKVLRSIPVPSAGAVGGFLPYAIHDVQWHPDGKFLAVCTGGVTVTVYDTQSGKVEATTKVDGLRAGGSAIFSPANPDHILIAHPDAAAVWQWKAEKEPQQKFAGLGKLVPSPDGKKVLSLQAGGGWHGNDFRSAAIVSADLKDRDTAGTKEYIPLIQHPGPSLAWHPEGKHLVVSRDGTNRITLRSLDGKVVEEVKPEGIDVTWLEWVSPVARRNILVGRIAQGPDTYLFDLGTKKLTAFGKVNGEITVSPDGNHLIALDGSTLTYWNQETKAVDQKVVLLPNGEFVTLSPAGEVLEASAKAGDFYRYVVEEKSGKLLLKSPAEMAPSLPKSTATAGPRWPLDPTPPDEIKYFHGLGVHLKVRDVNGDQEIRPADELPKKPVTVVWASFWDADASKVDDAVVRRLAKLTDLEHLGYNFQKYDGVSVTTEGSRALAALVNLRSFDVANLFKGGFDGAVIAKMPHLERLNVSGVPGSVWVKHLSGMTRLHTIDTFNTAISEEELGELAKLPRLTLLQLHHPGVSDDAVKAFAKKVPWCKVSKDVGGGNVLVIEPTAPPPPAGPTAFAPLDPEWVNGVAKLSADEQVKAVVAELKKRNPNYEGKHTHRVDGGVVVGLTVNGFVEDISPVRGLAGLKELYVFRTKEGSQAPEPIPLCDLSPLRGLKLTHVKLHHTKVTDLTPLRGMLLEQFEAPYAPLSDLSPLSGMPLGWVGLIGTRVSDLTPLKGASISLLDIRDTEVTDLSPIYGQPLVQLQGTGKRKDLAPLKEFPKLTTLAMVGPDVNDISALRGTSIQALDLRGTKVSDIAALRGTPLESLSLEGSKVTDLTPIKDCPLKALTCDYKPERDRELLLGIKTLETLNYKPAKDVLK